MSSIAELFIRIGISIVVLLILARIEGARQISQLTFYDYVIGITVGSLAGTLCMDTSIPIYFGVVSIVVFMLSGIIISWLTSKSMWARRILTGVPIFLIAQGELQYKALKKARYDMCDLLRELRVQGYFDLTEVNYAILETNGNLAVCPKSYARPPKVADMGLEIAEDSIKANVIIDGKILKGNLKAFGRDEAWLRGEMTAQNASALKDILLATMDENGVLNIFYKNNEAAGRTSLD